MGDSTKGTEGIPLTIVFPKVGNGIKLSRSVIASYP